jgi:hypothetical protein
MAQFKGIFGYHVTMSRSVHRIVRNGLVPTRGLRSRMWGESRRSSDIAEPTITNID